MLIKSALAWKSHWLELSDLFEPFVERMCYPYINMEKVTESLLTPLSTELADLQSLPGGRGESTEGKGEESCLELQTAGQ